MGKLLRHKSLEMTLSAYIHDFPTDQREAVDRAPWKLDTPEDTGLTRVIDDP